MKTGKIKRSALALAAIIATGLGGHPARAADTKVTLALPDTVVTMAWVFIAQAEGFWKQQGLDVDVAYLAGPAASQSVLSGDSQFTANTGVTVLGSVIHQQPLIAIASIQNIFTNAITISTEAAAKTGLTVATSTPAQRAKALKGMTIAADAPNSNLDAFIKHVVAGVGLDPEKDITRTSVPSPAMVGAMEAHRIDGFSTTSPWPFLAEQHKTGVIWIWGTRGDVPDLKVAAGNGISARSDYCAKNADSCREFLKGVEQAVDFIKSNPDKSLADIQPVFKNMDSQLLKESFDELKDTLTPGLAFNEPMWQGTQKLVIDAGIIKPSDAKSKYEGIAYTNAYLK